MDAKKHKIHDFIKDSEDRILKEYSRIQEKAVEDPGTAGDQGELNWAELLRQWLPTNFRVVTKGRILFEDNTASKQIDVLILSPSYPPILEINNHYLAAGVVAAFECKITLKSNHFASVFETNASIKSKLEPHHGSPYKELCPQILFGLLAHSHSWRSEKPKVRSNISELLATQDDFHIRHPKDCLDFVCVSDLGTWLATRIVNAQLLWGNQDPAILTGYMVMTGGKSGGFHSPIGIFLSSLYSKLAWNYTDMRTLEKYFRDTNIGGKAFPSGRLRSWTMDIYSEDVRNNLLKEPPVVSDNFFSEWRREF